MMDRFDLERYALIYRTLAELLERERPADRQENHLSYVLGNLARRVFTGTQYLPPDDLLEQVASLLRTGTAPQARQMARQLREQAQHLDDLRDIDAS